MAPIIPCDECLTTPAVVLRVISPIIRIYRLGPGNRRGELLEEHVESPTSVARLCVACYSLLET